MPISNLFFCNYDEIIEHFESETIENLWTGKYTTLIQNNNLVKVILSRDVTAKEIAPLIRSENADGTETALTLGISSLLFFCHANWSSKFKEEKLSVIIETEWPESIDSLSRLQRDSEEVDDNAKYSELLLLASETFAALCSLEENLIHLWWYLRSLVTHQRVLDNASPSLYAQVELTAAKLSNVIHTLNDYPRSQVLLLAEISQAFLVYGRVQRAEEFLIKAKSIAGLKLELRGVLGKRTKFQQDNLPQLALYTELDPLVSRSAAEVTHGATRLPQQVELQDDVRLNTIAYTQEEFKRVKLPSLDQLLCLLSVQYMQKSQPKDSLAEEELQPYIDTILRQSSGAWPVRVAALLVKCKLEAENKRTVERAMMQCEAVVNEAAFDDDAAVHKLSYLWGSGLAPCWCWRAQLADLYLSLGLVKAALEEYLSLQLWEDVIVCYTLLQLRHKAAEIIQQQIEVKPTPKLYCLLGDATDDVSCYARAWEFSGHKSSRAQRHWGNHLFDRKRYHECIPHFEKSLEINSLQERVWLRLGYAALCTENWETAAVAYRRYTYLQPNTFEAWNNLAKVYAKQGDKQRSYRALMEALKFNYDNWKLWENVITVSVDTGHFEDVLRGAHRLLDINGKFGDVEVLSLLCRAVLEDHADADGNSSARLRSRLLELLGRVTSSQPTDARLWRLYADVTPAPLQKAQRLQRAYRSFTQESEWPNNPETCKQVVEFTQELLNCSLMAKKQANEQESLQASQQLSSARLTGQSVIRAAEKQNWPDVEQSLGDLRVKFDEVVQFLKS